MALDVAVPHSKWHSRSSSHRIWLGADELSLIRTLREELGLEEVTLLLRLGLRAVVSLGVPPAELQKRRLSFQVTVRPNHKDLIIMASLRKALGKGASNSGIFRIALEALATKERLARAAMGNERRGGMNHLALVARERPPATVVPDHASLEPKMCEICGKSFLRVVGEEDKVCSGCEVRLAITQRACEASLERAKRDTPTAETKERMRAGKVKSSRLMTAPARDRSALRSHAAAAPA